LGDSRAAHVKRSGWKTIQPFFRADDRSLPRGTLDIVTDDRHLAGLIADLQRQRKDLEAMLDDTQRSLQSTAEIVEKIIDLKRRSEVLLSKKISNE